MHSLDDDRTPGRIDVAVLRVGIHEGKVPSARNVSVLV
jgi:hypothetical protein